jgi:hypothetical protein
LAYRRLAAGRLHPIENDASISYSASAATFERRKPPEDYLFIADFRKGKTG